MLQVCKLIEQMFVYHPLCYFVCEFDICILKKNNFAFSVLLKICASEFHEDDFMVTFLLDNIILFILCCQLKHTFYIAVSIQKCCTPLFECI